MVDPEFVRLGAVALAVCCAACGAVTVPGADGAAGVDSADTSGDAAALPDTASTTAAPGVCFKGAAPTGDVFVADVPRDDSAGCTPPPLPSAWFAEVPAPTLALTLGRGDAAGTFIPYLDGDWAPIFYGPQGGFHLWAGFRTQLPGKTDASLLMDVQVWSESSCIKVASGLGSVATVLLGSDGNYSNVYTGAYGLADAFFVPASSSRFYCGQWVTLHVRARLRDTGLWGESAVTVRIYDTKL